MAKESFKDFVEDQLKGLTGLLMKRMFGAYGLYLDETFFGILDQDKLYFKTSGKTRQDYIARGSKPFVYEKQSTSKSGGRKKKKVSLKRYYEVPVDVLEDSSLLREWARRSVEASQE
jgi:DNA transformation protein